MDDRERRRRLEALFNAHAGAVRAYAARRIDAATADDVVMEVFVIACRRLDEVPRESLPWLLGCARRVLANQRRSARRRDRVTDRLAESQAHVIAGPMPRTLGVALSALRDDDREVLLLVAWEGLDLGGLAKTLSCSRAAAAMRLHRARRKLAAAMRDADGDEIVRTAREAYVD